ncbi:MAG: DUF5618 family protein, partial [Phycisphaerales bacterium]|nr:DUF5618 family protein [Phycisphaerales bacterium]
AYNAVLLAMNEFLKQRNFVVVKKPHSRKNIDDYKRALSDMEEYDVLNYLNSSYNILHLYGYYDGECSLKVIATGFEMAYKIIRQIK